MSKTKLTLPVPLLKTLDELEETTNDNAHSNRLLEASRGVHADLKSKSKEMPQHSSARSSSSITTISNTTNIKTKLKQNPQLPFKKTSSNGRKKSISETSLDESAVSSEQSKPESYRPPSKPGLDYEKLVPSQCDCDLIQLKYINPYEKYLITRIFSSVGKLSSYLSDLSTMNLKHYLNTPDQNDFLPLYYAIKANNLTAVKYLINTGASLNKTTSVGDPAPHLACLVGCSTDLVDYLLSCLDMNSRVFKDDEKKSSLYIRDQEGWTVLHCACNQGNLNIVKHLVEKKYMNINVKDIKKNYTGLQLAIVNNRIEVIEYLLSFESMSFLKKNANETIFNSNIKRPCKSAMPIISTEALVHQPVQVGEIPAAEVAQEDQLTKRRSSSAISSSNRDKRQNSIVSLETKPIKKENKSYQSCLNLNQESYDLLEEVSNEHPPPKILNNAKPVRARTCVEPMSYYPIAEMFKTEPARYSNFQIVDIHSLNNDGHNVLHLGCKFGRFDVVNILLRKFGSNSLDINVIDFKGKTSMDLAWNWLISIKNTDHPDKEEPAKSNSSNKTIMHLFQEKLLNLNTHLDNEIQLLGLLNQYGAKFSSYQILFHEFNTNSASSTESDLNNTISNYLKCILYLFKLNLPTLFLNSTNTNSKQLNRNVALRDSITSLSTSSGSGSSSRYSASLKSHSSSFIISPSSNSMSSLLNLKQTTESFIQCFKRDMKQNLNELNHIIQMRFDRSSLEANLFLENIQIALDYLSRF